MLDFDVLNHPLGLIPCQVSKISRVGYLAGEVRRTDAMPAKKVLAKKKTGSSKGLKVSIDDETLKDVKKHQEVLAGIPRTLHRAESARATVSFCIASIKWLSPV